MLANLISGSSAFSKTSLNIRKFTVPVLLKPGLENFEHYFTSMCDECNCVVVWAFFGIAFLWDWNENWPFPVLWPLLRFQICWHIECSSFTASSFRIWNSYTEIVEVYWFKLVFQFPWDRSPSRPSLVAVKFSARVFSSGAWGPLPSWHLVQKLEFFAPVGPWLLFPCWILAEGHFQYCWPLLSLAKPLTWQVTSKLVGESFSLLSMLSWLGVSENLITSHAIILTR